MNINTKILFIITTLFLLFGPVGKAQALNLGTNITKFDGSSSDSNNWYGTNEDNEVEPDCAGDQKWDLEGFFLNGSELQVVGGFDFKNGYGGYKIGDIFIDIDGNYNPNVYSMTDNGNTEVSNNFGYEYVLDLAFDSDTDQGTYTIYNISGDNVYTSTVYYNQNQNSNPYRYVSGGQSVGTGTFSYHSGLSSTDVGGLLGDTHYALTGFDLGFIAGQQFTAHLTMQCGNDNLMGSGTAPVPEPATIILMGAGLAMLGGLARKKVG